MKETKISSVHAAKLMASSGNTAYAEDDPFFYSTLDCPTVHTRWYWNKFWTFLDSS